MADESLLIKEFLPLLTNQGVTMTRTLLPHAMLSTTLQHKSDSEEVSDSNSGVYLPASIDWQMGSFSEEIGAVSEFYDVGADPFFEFNDFDTTSIN